MKHFALLLLLASAEVPDTEPSKALLKGDAAEPLDKITVSPEMEEATK